MGTVHFSIGENLGKVLLDIAQEHILNGEPQEAIETYVKSFDGMDESYALQILRNNFVVETCEDGVNINLTDDKNVRFQNAEYIYDWQKLMNDKIKDLQGYVESYHDIVKQFNKHSNYAIYNANITEIVKRYYGEENMSNVGIHNIAAKLIAGDDFAWNLYSNGSDVWSHLEGDVESDEAKPYQYALYFIVKYVNLIRSMYKDYVKFEKSYTWLLDKMFIKRIPLVESDIENVLDIIKEFCNPNTGYYHSMCDEKITNLKETINDEILNTSWGKEYLQNGIIKKNIMDGYDAGWLSPDGEFYGGNGPTSAMIHMNIAEQIFNGNNVYANRMSKDGVSIWSGSNSPEYWLEKDGWVKIHHNDCYGAFIGERNPEDRTPDFPYAYKPTDIQIRMICDYADKFYGGKFYTEANTLGRDTHPDPFTTYKVRQMDEFKLHEIFGR